MVTDSERGFLEALTAALDPYLGGDARKELRALRDILDLFPGQTLTEVKKTVQSLQAGAQKDVPTLVARAKALVEGEKSESVTDFLRAVSGLKPDELKQFGTSLGLALTGTKAKLVADIHAWLESGGTQRPLTAEERAQQKVKEYAAGFEGRMGSLSSQQADELIRRAETAIADKKMTKQHFQEFAQLLGLSVSGTKPKMMEQFRNYVNRLAVSHGQTQF